MAPFHDPSDARQKIVDSLVGLPFAALQENPKSRECVAGQYPDGSKFRIAQVEDIWNAALCEAIDGTGACRKLFPPAELVVLAEAEKRYGCRIEVALPIWLNLPKWAYDRWDERPRVAWHGKVLE